jgi:CRP-like cAMP-binding protein
MHDSTCTPCGLPSHTEDLWSEILSAQMTNGKEDTTQRVLPKLSQETLAEMVGTTRSRVNFFMNKFRKLGLIEYNGGLKVNSSLLSIVFHD